MRSARSFAVRVGAAFQIAGRRTGGLSSRGGETEDGPGGEARVGALPGLGKAAVRLLVRGDVVGRRRGEGERNGCDGELHAQTTSVRSRRE